MTTPPKNQLGNIEHVVVLMLENRSFDNILGYLYDPGNPPPLNKKPRCDRRGLQRRRRRQRRRQGQRAHSPEP